MQHFFIHLDTFTSQVSEFSVSANSATSGNSSQYIAERNGHVGISAHN